MLLTPAVIRSKYGYKSNIIDLKAAFFFKAIELIYT